jgi:hypothetical protein
LQIWEGAVIVGEESLDAGDGVLVCVTQDATGAEAGAGRNPFLPDIDLRGTPGRHALVSPSQNPAAAVLAGAGVILATQDM